MKHILLLGAGRSSVYLIDYLISQAPLQDWHLTIADLDTQPLQSRFAGSPQLTLVNFNIHNPENLKNWVPAADLVISMLPAAFHLAVAKACLEFKKHFLTASYITPEIQNLHGEAQQNKLLFLMETGLDPGIDHLSAMETISRIQAPGGELLAFKSYTGGLVAPESDNNPWHYKISWNPRNVVLAGKGTATFLQNNKPKYIPYPQLFRRTEIITVPGLGPLEGYANRDSLLYRKAYNLDTIPTLLRGTLRWPGFCSAWHQLVTLGLTDDHYTVPNSDNITYAQWLEYYLPETAGADSILAKRLADFLKIQEDSPELEAIRYLGLLGDRIIGLKEASPAQILEQCLVQKLKLQPTDRDLVVMQHEFQYRLAGIKKRLKSSLVLEGKDATYTAMAKTVGMPLAFAAELILQEKITLTGVHLPIYPELYQPILARLKSIGIGFTEQEEIF
ncbi:saccharopine dehydrogenase NADP-binding domain-containing protein [Adhaeribacter swui]|uniref:Saccharopine dehydrogenase NADP-binding domain-containing protein n=1 Tax=Adhaeribacter swui TaxID=2086471 RepID=A0A7G7GCN4_9BACT|nr:saccharopine dehydrogenase C-terminal domain-containing protein [Adhaeribacter swui]QNF34918.1 saccharopine dehydrogenase NADP-binding domain-containing protein [Adhaeribacter swui]